MAYVSSFVYCDSIQTHRTQNGLKQEIVRPLQVLSPIAIPGNFSFSVSCNLAGFNPNEDNAIRLQFVSPSGENVYDTNNFSFKVPAEDLNEKKPAVMQFNLDLRNLVFKEDGIYTTKVYFNEELIGEYKIDVMMGDQP